MTVTPTPRWLDWAREIQALAQTGNTYSENHWQTQRYERLMEISAEMIGAHSDLPVASIVEDFNAQLGYATPKLDVRGAVFKNGKLLMVEEILDGGWTMPGGWADVGDTPTGAVEREVWEESGFIVKAYKLVGVYDANRVGPLQLYHAVKLVYLCDITGGEATSSDETSAVKFFAEDEIPSDLSGERTRPRHIQDAFAALADDNRLAVIE